MHAHPSLARLPKGTRCTHTERPSLVSDAAAGTETRVAHRRGKNMVGATKEARVVLCQCPELVAARTQMRFRYITVEGQGRRATRQPALPSTV